MKAIQNLPRKRELQVPVETLRHAAMWLGKMIADGAHQNSVLPRDCEITLAQIKAILADAARTPRYSGGTK